MRRAWAFADGSPFGKENTSFWQFPSLTPSDAANRKRLIHTLAALDATVCLDGGWLLPMGQEDALRRHDSVIGLGEHRHAGARCQRRREQDGQGAEARR